MIKKIIAGVVVTGIALKVVPDGMYGIVSLAFLTMIIGGYLAERYA